MRKAILLTALAVLLVLLPAGCTPAALSGDLLSGVKAADWPDPPAQMDSQFQAPMMNFAWSLFRASAANEGNVLISPTSVYLALAMTINGAGGDTLTAMRTALQAQDLSMDDLNAACRDWISLMRGQTEKTTVSVANSIWFRQDYPVSTDFLQTDADYFDAEAQALDFNKNETVDAINGWVREQTGGAIEKIIDKINVNTVMYLINAVYFKSDWQTPFNAGDTGEGEFAAAQGTVTAEYMHRTGPISYVLQEGVEGVMLPYDDGRYSFFAVMPPEGQDVRAFLSGLDGGAVLALLSAMEEGTVALTLPKFETRWEDSLRDELTALGMGLAFDEAAADFSGMDARGAKDLFISDVLHKTFCRVDEKGTEAAAVTSVDMAVKSAPREDAQIRFDRPFLYGIVDRASGTPLFLGILEDPSR